MNTYLLKNINIYDGEETSDIINCDIYIENGIIKEIGNITNKNVKSIDMQGKYAIPGLINLHVHLPASGKISKTPVAEKKKLIKKITSNSLMRKIGIGLCAKYAKMELKSGVTTIRTVGGIADFDTILRDEINTGKKIGPRILAANTAIGVINGHMDGTVAKAASNNNEGIEMIKSLKSENVDLIKLMITGGILDSKERGKIGLLKMPADMVKCLCDEAHKEGLRVAAHVEGSEGVKIAIENGVDTIEHGAPVDDSTLLMLKNENKAYVATFSPAIPLSFLDPALLGYSADVSYNSKVLLDGMIEFTNKCLANKITVGLGTDTGCPLVTHYDMWRELCYFKKYANVTNKYAIHTATLINAKIAGVSKETGSISIGKSADLLIIDQNPLNNLEVLRNPKLVIYKGKIIKGSNKKYSKIEDKLDIVLKKL